MIEQLLKQECDLEFFHTHGYQRKKCASCGSYFWTLDSKATLCGDQPCVPFSFINKHITKKALSLREVRNHFLSYFEEQNHSRLHYPETGERCPVIARWRTDIYLTIASIADFQPHITSGVVPPPANPLVISQPCIRLNDLEEVGRSGRHLTMFEMMGHHAFNKNINEIYWKNETVAYCDEFFRTRIGIPREMINYKEHLWIGGGNAGPCIEVLAGGLEIATLVFMNMKEDPKGPISIEGAKYTQNPLNIVDTGYGLERIAWFTQGTQTVYDTAFPEVIQFLKNRGLQESDMPSVYALADHTKCLAFMLGDGIVPSNVKAGYLARLIIRRSLRYLEKLGTSLKLQDIVNMHLDILDPDFPSLKKRKNQIDEILEIETKRYYETLSKGENLVKRILGEKKQLEVNDLIMLYDTHGMPPDVVQNIAANDGVHVDIPKNFDSMIAELHSHEKEVAVDEQETTDLPETILLYYTDHYTQEFDATVLWKQNTHDVTKIVLDQTAFYPDGGGQPSDFGFLLINGQKLSVTYVEKHGKAILHSVQGTVHVGDSVHGKIDWDRRYTLMKHHTGTHVVNGALRSLFGEHIWQAGSQLGVSEARFDFSHYKPITDAEIKQIEVLANDFIQQGAVVEKKVLERNVAEKTYGFRLYQGGVPPGNMIRVLNIPGLDVEACGGTHLNNINEIEKIKILRAERIQDGVNRIFFAAGKMVDVYQNEEAAIFSTIVAHLEPMYSIQQQNDISEQLKESAKIFSVSLDQFEKTVQRFMQETGKKPKKNVTTLVDACNDLFTEWKRAQKQKKTVTPALVDELKKKASTVPTTDIRIITAECDGDSIALAGAIIQEDNYIVHLFDGKKITSAASENVNIDLRKIAPALGSLLGGSGGGKPKMTQSGGPNKQNIAKILEQARQLTEKEIIGKRG